MNYEFITIIITIVIAWGSLAVFIWSIHKDIADLRECMARLEGLFEGFTGRTSPRPEQI